MEGVELRVKNGGCGIRSEELFGIFLICYEMFSEILVRVILVVVIGGTLSF